MTTHTRPPALVFMDTETLGLDPEAPVWEFAAIRREWPPEIEQWGGDVIATVQNQETKYHFFIDHRSEPWVTQMLTSNGTSFVKDYQERFNARDALTTYQAAEIIYRLTKDAHIVGAVPSFDTERLAALLRSRGFEPAWHYHLVDVENMIVGYLAGKGEPVDPPYKSEALSRAVGVNPEDFARHTAFGDVLWIKAQYDAMMTHE